MKYILMIALLIAGLILGCSIEDDTSMTVETYRIYKEE